jgi:REP element-mobilizing transposase RayT
VIAINGLSDHIHLLIKFPSTVTVSEIVKQAKGVSSRLMNQYLMPGAHFRWQGGYGSFTVSRWDLPMIINYIENQEKIHHEECLNTDLESVCTEGK